MTELITIRHNSGIDLTLYDNGIWYYNGSSQYLIFILGKVDVQ